MLSTVINTQKIYSTIFAHKIRQKCKHHDVHFLMDVALNWIFLQCALEAAKLTGPMSSDILKVKEINE